MKYPNGQTVRIGDLIWWNEGESLGFVYEIYEHGIDLGEVVYTEPTMSIANRHPFDPDCYGGILNLESQLADEGVGLLTSEEKNRLDQATSKALEIAGPHQHLSFFSIHTECIQGKIISWRFEFTDLNRKTKSVVIPWEKQT